MKIGFVEVCGFRGYKEPIRLDFRNSFTVISGRNGVGKSTICDAIEFAITGNIKKYSVETSDKEGPSDYYWWRGKGSAANYFVRIGLIDDDGKLHKVVRTRQDGLLEPSDKELTDLLCTQFGRPDNPLEQLCRTSIIRDEWIAAQSLDLGERQRFDLVSAALGELGSADYGQRARKVKAIADEAFANAETAYETSRVKLSHALSTLSEEQSKARQAGDISTALANIAKYIAGFPDDISEATVAARSYLTTAQRQISALHGAVVEAREIFDEKITLGSEEFLSSKTSLIRELEDCSVKQAAVAERISDAKIALEAEERSHAVVSALSKIIEGGEALGLQEGSCPLCAAERSQKEFDLGLARAREQVGELGEKLAAARKRIDSLQLEHKNLAAQIALAAEKFASIEHREKLLVDRQGQQIEFFAKYSLDFDAAPNPDILEKRLLQTKSNLIEVERNLAKLESSNALARVADKEGAVAELREMASAATVELERRKKAASMAREFDRAVRRTKAEIIDERLAEISPLLVELYQRLRPHSDWRSIEYSIRGDVRRFMSLKVGDKLNPQFIFSSGERRAAGIAFLISIYLSRPWCRLNTLILDDPVQHIDDFRAVHLVELLASLRRDGHQIICSVEDASLATLLTRRLSSTHESPGNRYDLSKDGSGRVIGHALELAPMPTNTIEVSTNA